MGGKKMTGVGDVGAIYLIGFMGAGKTTIGKELANFLQLPVIDTDVEIEKIEGKKISDIFAEQGEEYFRELETNVLKELPTTNAIITTGGGIIKSEKNQQWMKKHGTIVFLYATPEEITKRLQSDVTRPLLLQNKQKAIDLLYKERLPIYESICDLLVDTTEKDVTTIANEITARFSV
jgi:shikimate kinase